MEESHALLRQSGIAAYPPGYMEYFQEFNAARFFEAHEVLEPHWLLRRGQTDADFFKGLIQLAGAFVHIQKNRLHPALALFRLAETNLVKYPGAMLGVNTSALREICRAWGALTAEWQSHGQPLSDCATPSLDLPAFL